MHKREIEITIGQSMVDLENVVTGSDRKLAIYTAIFSDYDEPPVVQEPDSRIDYILFTDGSIKTAPAPWQLRAITPIFADPQRDARRVKLLPHLFLPRHYETSVWVDASLFLRDVTVKTIDGLLANSDIAVTQHNVRRCIYDEAEAVLAVKYDAPARVVRQMDLYRMRGFPKEFGLHATMFLARRHTSDKCLAFDLDWWEEVSRNSKRDQLSFDYVRWRHKDIAVNTLQMDVFRNPIFGLKMKDGTEHKSGNRVVDEHLHVRLRPSEAAAPATAISATARYSDVVEIFPLDFLSHLRNLRRIVRACAAESPTDFFSSGSDSSVLYAPPDPRMGEEREIFLRALAGRARLFEMHFGDGARTAMALTHTPLSVTALDMAQTRYGRPCSGYINSYFHDRFAYVKPDLTAYMAVMELIPFDAHDAVHIDAADDADTAIFNLAYAIIHARNDAVLIVSGISHGRVYDAISLLRRRGIISPYGDLQSVNQAAFTVQLAAANRKDAMLPVLLEPAMRVALRCGRLNYEIWRPTTRTAG